MIQRNSLAEEFCSAYFGILIPRLRIPRTIKQRVRDIQTIIIDTPQLTDGAMRFSHAWSLTHTADDVTHCAARALAGHTDTQAAPLRDTLPYTSPLHRPESITKTKHSYTSIYPHGTQHIYSSIGALESILRRCDLTENEREEIRLAARHQARRGRIIYAIGEAASVDTTTPRLEFVGLVFYSLALYPGTEVAIQHLREYGYSIIYASQDEIERVGMLAHVSCLVPRSILPAYPVMHTFAMTAPVYAQLSEHDKQRLINHLPRETTIIAKHPLPKFVELISATR